MKMRDILSREAKNTQDVYLYEVEGHWYAYGHSAQLIKQSKQKVIKIYGNVNDWVEVDFKSAIEMCTIILCSDSEMVLKC